MNINEKKEIVQKRLETIAQKFLNDVSMFDTKLDRETLLDMIETGELSAKEIGAMFSNAIKEEVFRK